MLARSILFRCLPAVLLPACFAQADPLIADDGGGSESAGADSSSDAAEGGTPVFESLGGTYDAELRTVACSGDCTGAMSSWGTETFCDVGDAYEESLAVEHDADALTVDTSDARLRGTIDADGAFHVEGKSTEEGTELVIEYVADGSFAGRHEGFRGTVRYSAVGTYDGSAIDCHGEVEVVATWRSDGCGSDPGICPEAYPICVDDGCYAGVAGDPCSLDDDCSADLVCRDWNRA
jgi:hypothetical protein